MLISAPIPQGTIRPRSCPHRTGNPDSSCTVYVSRQGQRTKGLWESCRGAAERVGDNLQGLSLEPLRRNQARGSGCVGERRPPHSRAAVYCVVWRRLPRAYCVQGWRDSSSLHCSPNVRAAPYRPALPHRGLKLLWVSGRGCQLVLVATLVLHLPGSGLVNGLKTRRPVARRSCVAATGCKGKYQMNIFEPLHGLDTGVGPPT